MKLLCSLINWVEYNLDEEDLSNIYEIIQRISSEHFNWGIKLLSAFTYDFSILHISKLSEHRFEMATNRENNLESMFVNSSDFLDLFFEVAVRKIDVLELFSQSKTPIKFANRMIECYEDKLFIRAGVKAEKISKIMLHPSRIKRLKEFFKIHNLKDKGIMIKYALNICSIPELMLLICSLFTNTKRVFFKKFFHARDFINQIMVRLFDILFNDDVEAAVSEIVTKSLK